MVFFHAVPLFSYTFSVRSFNFENPCSHRRVGQASPATTTAGGSKPHPVDCRGKRTRYKYRGTASRPLDGSEPEFDSGKGDGGAQPPGHPCRMRREARIASAF